MTDKHREKADDATTDEPRRTGGKRDRPQGSRSRQDQPGDAILADTDPALDTESETKANLERATGRDRMTGES